MDQATHNKIVSSIWGIADDVLRDLFTNFGTMAGAVESFLSDWSDQDQSDQSDGFGISMPFHERNPLVEDREP